MTQWGKGLTVQVWESEFKSQNPHMCNPSTSMTRWTMETRELLASCLELHSGRETTEEALPQEVKGETSTWEL